MLTGIDHLVIAVEDPDLAVAALAAELGLHAGGGGRHDALGTFNRLVWFGDAYLELIGVFDERLAAASWIGAPAVRALRRGGGFATWAIATDDIDGDVARLARRGADLSEPIAGERRRSDGALVRWRVATPSSLGPDAAPFLIEHDTTAAEWTATDRAARAGSRVGLVLLELLVDVPVVTRRLARSAGLTFRPSLAGGGARDADVGPQIVRLRPTREPGVPVATIGLAIAGAQVSQIDLLGCRWRINP
jgi:hypothetical protein